MGQGGGTTNLRNMEESHDKPEVPQTPTWLCFTGNWPCKSEVLGTPGLDIDERQPPASR